MWVSQINFGFSFSESAVHHSTKVNNHKHIRYFRSLSTRLEFCRSEQLGHPPPYELFGPTEVTLTFSADAKEG